jgi:hypothetical protein
MINELLKPFFSVYRNEYTGTAAKYVVYKNYNERPTLHASGKLKEETQYVQVDLYSKANTDTDKELIKTTLRNAGIGITDIQERRESGYNRVIFDCVVMTNE